MRYLTLSVCLLFIGCGSYIKKEQLSIVETKWVTIINPYFANTAKDCVYKASIEAYGRNFSGLLIIKKIGADHHRVVFTTEMGNKMFDFTFLKDELTINFIPDELNKKILLNVLKEDFTTLLKEQLDKVTTYTNDLENVYHSETKTGSLFYYFSKNGNLNKIVKEKHGKAGTIFSFDKLNDHIAEQITIDHKTKKLRINLRSI